MAPKSETDQARAESLLAKIKNAANSMKISMPMAMRRYAYERMLSVMAENGMSEGFCIKGGMLLGTMFKGRLLRPTEDLDLNGLRIGMSIRDMGADLRKIAAIHSGNDGLRFDIDSLKIVKNRDDDIIKGGKLHLMAYIGKARIPLKIDIGYGNPITPGVEMIKMPTLIPGLIDAIPFQAYPMETVISEKVHAMYRHGLLNTRHKDYFDIMMLAQNYEIDGATLADALVNTFEIFLDKVPEQLPALTKEFSSQRSHQSQWQAFLLETHAESNIPFTEAVEYCSLFLIPVIQSIHGNAVPGLWTPQSGWHSPSQRIAI